MNEMKQPSSARVFAGFAVAVIIIASGCANHQRTTTSEVTTVSEPESRHVELNDESENSGSLGVKTTTTSTNEVHDSDHDSNRGGLLSGTIGIIGDIIALPFRLVAGLFELIF